MVSGHEPQPVDTKIEDVKYFDARECLQSSANTNTKHKQTISFLQAIVCSIMQVLKSRYFDYLKASHERCAWHKYAELQKLVWSMKTQGTCNNEKSLLTVRFMCALSPTARGLRRAVHDTSYNSLISFQFAWKLLPARLLLYIGLLFYFMAVEPHSFYLCDNVSLGLGVCNFSYTLPSSYWT